MTERTSQDGALLRDLAFSYRLYSPADSTDECLFLLHGSGVDETTLVPLAREIAPHAVLIAVRGRIVQEDGFRWFARITPTRFEQASIRTETEAFAGFVADAAARHHLDLSRTMFLGYSNGANLVSSLMLLRPGLVERAALLRPMPVLDDVPATDLSKVRALIIAGAADLTYAPFAPALVTLLSQHGAEIDARIVASGHEFGSADAAIVRQWLTAPATVAQD
ncbi:MULTISPECIES: alpha/beta hydrolase [Mesorhizobium]|jgi:phospholipase/carboxylesterase|uniref:Phospholipase/carboxylesterase n=1 Tax=Rhizobium loti TaxID=381 RepID=A0A8E3B3N2_RHILI|nr:MULTISPECIES: alpha/beta hydrolase [Mesorhizobium]AZO42819.1 alpha/beta hydrolase [Mesorhizobium sp. M7D.F.Ca.US.005.01.1.1]PWJ89385.1 phospholipase/carboxylesterase [Mesorhizobium loti]RUX90335.1 alpha/beta hydrolase [Mesorhizobium sp. M7D.F.Ca.US.004.01.2.1]RVA29038.1 alpha/beta hydrolase [Mesorhizobium sp. M7D.F.Ca.US.004.03.1.1]